MRLGPTATFDEVAELYDADPVTFLEEILTARYECATGDECVDCKLWDTVSGGAPRHITRKNHDTLGNLPQPHRFEPRTGFYRLAGMSKEQALHHAQRLRRADQDDHADLLGLYYRKKFQRSGDSADTMGTSRG